MHHAQQIPCFGEVPVITKCFEDADCIGRLGDRLFRPAFWIGVQPDEGAEQFAGLAAWTADEARWLDHGDREKLIEEESRRTNQRLLQATFVIDAFREERAASVTSAAGIRHGTAEKGTKTRLTSIFGPVDVTRIAYRNWQEPALHPYDARQALPDDPYSLGMRALAADCLARTGFAQAQKEIKDRTGEKIGLAQLQCIADDLARWAGDFYEERARDAGETRPPPT